MFNKIIKFIILAAFITIIPAKPVLAGNAVDNFANIHIQGLESVLTGLSGTSISIKKGQPYDEASDPAFRSFKSGPVDESPQHGYFAVPLLVIGLAAILLFFIRND